MTNLMQVRCMRKIDVHECPSPGCAVSVMCFLFFFFFVIAIVNCDDNVRYTASNNGCDTTAFLLLNMLFH